MPSADHATPHAGPLASGDAASAPLRGTDWRHLLPRPARGRFEHLVLLGASPALAAHVRALGLADAVHLAVPDETMHVDAVVVLHGARVPLARAVAALAPGGVLYAEIERWRGGPTACSPRRARAVLERHGARVTGLFAVGPDFAAPRSVIPLHVPGALRWFIETRHVAPTLGARGAELALRLVTRLDGRRFAALAPRFAIVAVRGAEDHAQRSALAVPDEGVADGGVPDDEAPRGTEPLLLAPGGDRVIVLPFARAGGRPRAVIKAPRLAAFNTRTENEHARAAAIRARLDPALARAIPEPLVLSHTEGVAVAVERYLPGTMLACTSGRWGRPLARKVDDLTLAAAWLTRFHAHAVLRRVPWDGATRREWVDAPAESFRTLFGASAAEEALFADARHHAAALDDVALPIVWQHRDYTVWNLARDGDALAVLDWEGVRPGPALIDLLHLIVSWGAAVRGQLDVRGEVAALRHLFLGQGDDDVPRRACRAALDRYLAALGMPRALCPVLLVHFAVELALRRADQQRLQGTSAADARAGNEYLAFVNALAEGRERLFAPEGA